MQCFMTIIELFFLLFAVNLVGCAYINKGPFSLQCRNSQISLIHVVNVTVGRSSSKCRDEEKCCPSPTDDVVEGTPDSAQALKDTCDGWHKCEVNVPELMIGGEPADYVSVNYVCSNTPQGKITVYYLIAKVIHINLSARYVYVCYKYSILLVT